MSDRFPLFRRFLVVLSRRRVVTLVAVALLLFSLVSSLTLFQPEFLREQLADRNPDVLFYHETQDRVIALTIDDAPDSLLTPALLDLFAAEEVDVTFFVIGERVAGNESLLERMRAEGHEIGNHMMKDSASIMLSEEQFLTNLLAAEQVIGLTDRPKWWRPASGWFSPDMLRIARDNGYRACLGSLYPFDNKIRQPRIISWIVRHRVHPGAVLVLHEGGRQRDYVVPLLKELIPQLKAAGYRFVTVSQLVAENS